MGAATITESRYANLSHKVTAAGIDCAGIGAHREVMVAFTIVSVEFATNRNRLNKRVIQISLAEGTSARKRLLRSRL